MGGTWALGSASEERARACASGETPGSRGRGGGSSFSKPNRNQPDRIALLRALQVQGGRTPSSGREQLGEIRGSRVRVCVGGYSQPSVPTSFRLRIYLTLAASFCLLGVLKTRPLGCLPKLSRFGGRLGFTAPKGFRPCCVCILHCKSHGLKKKKKASYTHISARLSMTDRFLNRSLTFYYSAQLKNIYI